MKPFRHPQLRSVIALFVILLGAPLANAAEQRLGFSVEPEKLIEGRASVAPVEPTLCGSELGWIETVSSRMDAKAEAFFLPGGDRIKVRRGDNVDLISIGQAAPTEPYAGVMTADYKLCVIPSGVFLVELQMDVAIQLDEGERDFSVAYAGAPLFVDRWFDDASLAKLTVASDRGEAVVSRLRLSDELRFSPEAKKASRILLRLETKGATQ